MALFQTKADLPAKDQAELDRVSAIASAQRTSVETAFLTARNDYLYNEVLKRDSNDDIVEAQGVTVPTGLEGFAKGALFHKVDVTDGSKGLYENVGTTTSATWNTIGDAAASDITLPDGKILIGNASGVSEAKTPSGEATMTREGVISIAPSAATPVNAVAASKVLTLTGNALNNETVTIGGQAYTFQIAIGSAAAATGLLTVSGQPVDNESLTIGAKVYRWRTTLGAGTAASKVLTFTGNAVNTNTMSIAGTAYTFVTALTEVKATGVLTAAANPTDGNSVTIGSKTYTFRETLSVANDILIGVSASTTLDNLVAAINGAAGAGSTYGTGTTAHTTVVAAAGAGDTVDITAQSVGTSSNSIATTELGTAFSWGAATLAGGVNAVVGEIVIGGTAEASIDNAVAATTGAAGAGTTYATGTTQPTGVTVTKSAADTLTATASAVGYAGNSIVIAETLANAAWAGGATALSGGIDAQAANDVLIGANAEAAIDNLVLAITGGAGAGTNYGTGTVASTEVTAVKASAATMTITASAAGESGNSIATTTSATNCAFGAGTLAGGESTQTANDVLIGSNASDTIDNLIAAINGAAGSGTTYGSGTVANASATAAIGAGDTMTASAIVKGVVGNSIAIAEGLTNGSWAAGATFLSGGVDGTVGAARSLRIDSSYLYVATAANTIADANWRRITLGSVY